MTAKAVRDASDFDDLPVPQWVRPLSVAEQLALLKEAQDEIDCGELLSEAESNRRLDEIVAGTYRE